jgi:hypothetical protein
VPLIQNLVHQFQEIFCHLTITHVWLLSKSKSDDGFQGWHQDKLTGITNTIVVNLGGSNNISNDEDDRMGQKNTLMDNNKIQQSEGVNYSGNKEDCAQRSNGDEKLQARRICHKGYENVWKSCT